MLELLTHWGLVVLVFIFVVNEILQAMYDFFRWPGWLVRLRRRGEDDRVREILSELGVRGDVGRAILERDNRARVRTFAATGEVHDRATVLLRTRTARASGLFSVGRRRPRNFSYYIDAMSGSVDPDFCDEAANIMLAHLHESSPDKMDFTAVVGIKSGSPLLARAVAAKLGVRLVLHRGTAEAKPVGVGSHPQFDGEIETSTRVLVVDDSSTGGRMITECLDALGAIGAQATHVLVLFEPVGQRARRSIETRGVPFLAALPLDDTTLAELGVDADRED